jgi:hypothetical protein
MGVGTGTDCGAIVAHELRGRPSCLREKGVCLLQRQPLLRSGGARPAGAPQAGLNGVFGGDGTWLAQAPSPVPRPSRCWFLVLRRLLSRRRVARRVLRQTPALTDGSGSTTRSSNAGSSTRTTSA